MKENILIGLAVLILATMWLQIANMNTKNRYDVVTGSNMLTILVDKKQEKPGEIAFAERNQMFPDVGKNGYIKS